MHTVVTVFKELCRYVVFRRGAITGFHGRLLPKGNRHNSETMQCFVAVFMLDSESWRWFTFASR